VEEVIPMMFQKTIYLYVLLNLHLLNVISISFNLWMPKCGMDTFAIIIKILNEVWVFVCVIIGLFEVTRYND